MNVDSIEFHSVNGVFVKTMDIKQAGTSIRQHSHEYDHMSLVARGSVRVWRDGELLGDFKSPNAIEILARTKHKFLSLEPNTLVLCIHNVSRTGAVEIHELHESEGVCRSP